METQLLCVCFVFLGVRLLLDLVGEDAFACWELFTHLVLGWPMYILFNTTGARRTPEGDKITTVRSSRPPSTFPF
jgi:hypothetical protein